jgi:hypothetical protein
LLCFFQELKESFSGVKGVRVVKGVKDVCLVVLFLSGVKEVNVVKGVKDICFVAYWLFDFYFSFVDCAALRLCKITAFALHSCLGCDNKCLFLRP